MFDVSISPFDENVVELFVAYYNKQIYVKDFVIKESQKLMACVVIQRFTL